MNFKHEQAQYTKQNKREAKRIQKNKNTQLRGLKSPKGDHGMNFTHEQAQHTKQNESEVKRNITKSTNKIEE